MAENNDGGLGRLARVTSTHRYGLLGALLSGPLAGLTHWLLDAVAGTVIGERASKWIEEHGLVDAVLEYAWAFLSWSTDHALWLSLALPVGYLIVLLRRAERQVLAVSPPPVGVVEPAGPVQPTGVLRSLVIKELPACQMNYQPQVLGVYLETNVQNASQDAYHVLIAIQPMLREEDGRLVPIVPDRAHPLSIGDGHGNSVPYSMQIGVPVPPGPILFRQLTQTFFLAPEDSGRIGEKTTVIRVVVTDFAETDRLEIDLLPTRIKQPGGSFMLARERADVG